MSSKEISLWPETVPDRGNGTCFLTGSWWLTASCEARIKVVCITRKYQISPIYISCFMAMIC